MMNAREMFEEEKQETKQETNFEHYKDEIIKDYAQNLAVVKGRPTLCYKTNCNDCDFKINQIGCLEKAKDWLKQPHEKPVYKLTKFEKELLQCYPDIYSFKVFNSLNGMKEKGYFKGIDDNEIIGVILAKCEVIEDRKAGRRNVDIAMKYNCSKYLIGVWKYNLKKEGFI